MTAKQRILIADDETDIALILKLQLEEEGYETCRARDGQETMALLEKELFDLVLLDIRMPRLDGIEVLKRLKAQERDVAVVIMTAHGSERMAVEALQHGALDYVAKPFANEEIVSKVKRALVYRYTANENKRLQQKVAEERNLFEAVLQGMADLLVVTDSSGNVLLLNKAAEEVLGTSSDLAAGRPVGEVITADIPVDRLPSLQALSTGEPCLDAGYTITARRQVQVLSSATPLRDSEGNVQGSVEIMRDISARKALEREKEDFVSMLSHDLKTPITAIVGSIDLVRESRLGPVNAEQKEFLDTAVESCSDMVEMIDNLLDIHKFEAGMAQLKPTKEGIFQLVDRAVYGLRAAAENKGLSLIIDIPPDLPAIMVDRSKTIRLVANLVANAVKFTPGGGEIIVSGRADDMTAFRERVPEALYREASRTIEGPCLVLTVEDTGIGIGASDLSIIFDRFVQAKSRRQGKTQGTGLGLAFCRKVMDACGGFIWAESAQGKGSRFTVLFPLPLDEEDGAGN